MLMSTPPPPFGQRRLTWPFEPHDMMHRVPQLLRGAPDSHLIWLLAWPLVILLLGDLAFFAVRLIHDIVAPASGAEVTEAEWLRSLYMMLVATDMAFIWLFARWLARRGLATAVLDFRPERWTFETGQAVVLLLLTLVFGSALTDAITDLFPLPTETHELPVPGEERFAVWYMVPAIVILGPYLEEVVFRGWMLPALARRMGGWVLPILISSAMFGLLHIYVGAPVVIYTFVLGVCAALARRVTGRMWAPILLHSANNALSLAGS
jgi:membrane protease YdiL (CAAX protease family)